MIKSWMQFEKVFDGYTVILRDRDDIEYSTMKDIKSFISDMTYFNINVEEYDIINVNHERMEITLI